MGAESNIAFRDSVLTLEDIMLKSGTTTGAWQDARHYGDKWIHARDSLEMEDDKDRRRNL